MNRTPLKNQTFTLISFISLLCFPCFGDTAPRYRVEVLIFSRLNNQNLTLEQWPTIDPKKTINRAQFQTEQYQRFLNRIQLKIRPPIENRMAAISQKLQAHHYPVLLDTSWEQEIGGPSDAQPTQLFGGLKYSDQQEPDSKASWQVNGSIKISVDHYFNVSLNLLFAEPIAKIRSMDATNYFASQSGPLTYFHLDQNRRTRSNELNYVDFPLYGVLFEISKIKSTHSVN